MGQVLAELTRAVDEAFAFARAAEREAGGDLLEIPGMSGWRYRIFVNRLVRALAPTSYLEVGSWMGSTLCSVIAGNRVWAVAIDNWSEFGGPRQVFFENVARFRSAEARVRVIETDFRKVDFGGLGPFRIYLFDGPHGEQDQMDGIAMALPALAREFILIVDDWNYPPVPAGTMRAVAACGLTIEHSVEIKTSQDGSHPAVHSEHSEWHNGYFFGVVSKPF
jgi:hypothetical protein